MAPPAQLPNILPGMKCIRALSVPITLTNPGTGLAVSISPGDSISATVSYASTGFTLSITDSTNSGTYTATNPTLPAGYAAQRSSAEWIVEAPFEGHILPLANFSTTPVTFSAAAATINGTSDPLAASPAWPTTPSAYTVDQIILVDPYGGTATPGSLDPSSGGVFTVTYAPLTTTTPSPTPRPPTPTPPPTTPTPPSHHHHHGHGWGWFSWRGSEGHSRMMDPI